ncbi:MAG: hypothetical protein IT379_31140 [Deltaproteobacteria bacterium]|nr:hypothetical protein [Deltaproteobacteria bacterium]
MIAADDQSISMTETSIAADGTPETVRLSARFDDQYYPVIGSRHLDRFAIRRVDTHTLHSRATRAGRLVSTASLVLAPDGNRLTEEVETTLADGARTRATLVFDRAR